MVKSLANEYKWQAEDDLRTLLNAEEIKEDKKRMKAVRECAKERLMDLAKISVMKDEPESKD
jgi:hypothetical protein